LHRTDHAIFSRHLIFVGLLLVELGKLVESGAGPSASWPFCQLASHSALPFAFGVFVSYCYGPF